MTGLPRIRNSWWWSMFRILKFQVDAFSAVAPGCIIDLGATRGYVRRYESVDETNGSIGADSDSGKVAPAGTKLPLPFILCVCQNIKHILIRRSRVEKLHREGASANVLDAMDSLVELEILHPHV